MSRHCILILALLLGRSPLLGATLEGKRILEKRIDEFVLDGAPNAVWEVQLSWLCKKARVPCGIESLNEEYVAVGGKTIRFQNESLANILDRVVSQQPGYRWFEENGVINIAPRARSVLTKRKIKTLDIVDIPLDKAAAEVICQKFGRRCYAAARAISMMGVGNPSQYAFRKVTLHLSNVSFREALNAVVRKDVDAIWILHPNKTQNGDFRIAIDQQQRESVK